MDDFDGPQFCDDYGYCICGNDCGAGCCSPGPMCDGHRAAYEELVKSYQAAEPPAESQV